MENKIREVIKNLSKKGYTKAQAIKDLSSIVGATLDLDEVKNYPKIPYSTGMLLGKDYAQVIRKGIYKASYTATCGDRTSHYGHYIDISKDRIYMATGNSIEPLFVLDEQEKCWRKASLIPADNGDSRWLEHDCYNDFYRMTVKLG